jgi:hypothetical protein
MLLKFHLPKWQNITYATICSYLQCSHNESWQAPVLLFASCPFIVQHDYCIHKLKQTQSCCILSFEWFPGAWILSPNFLNTLPVPSSCLHCLWRRKRQCSKTSKNKIQTPRNHSKERMKHSEHGKCLKSRNTLSFITVTPQFVLHSNNNTLQSVHPPHVWNSTICTQDCNLNWEWKFGEFWLYFSSDVSFYRFIPALHLPKWHCYISLGSYT